MPDIRVLSKKDSKSYKFIVTVPDRCDIGVITVWDWLIANNIDPVWNYDSMICGNDLFGLFYFKKEEDAALFALRWL